MPKRKPLDAKIGDRVGWDKHPELSYEVIAVYPADARYKMARARIRNSEGHEQVVLADEIWRA